MDLMIFDYESASRELEIPEHVMRAFEKEAKQEFPFDSMLMELHVIRALNAYAANSELTVSKHA